MKVFRVVSTCAFFFLFSFSQVCAGDKEDDARKLKVGLSMWFDGYVMGGSGWEGPVSELYFEVTGKARIPGTLAKQFFILEITGEWEEETAFVRFSHQGDFYGYAGFGAEFPVFLNLEVGSYWDYEDGGESWRATIKAIEDVTVPAGLFRDCVKVRKQCLSCSDPGEVEWFKVGFMLVQGIDWGDSPPTLSRLRSVERLHYPDDD